MPKMVYAVSTEKIELSRGLSYFAVSQFIEFDMPIVSRISSYCSADDNAIYRIEKVVTIKIFKEILVSSLPKNVSFNLESVTLPQSKTKF